MPQKHHLAQLKDASAIQHGDDTYWYRPLVLGDEIFTYVAHVPPSGYLPPHKDGEHDNEFSLYMLEGELLIYYGDEEFTIGAHTALFVPKGVLLGVRNETEETATFVLTFCPPPTQGTMEEFWARVRNPDKIKTPDQIREIIGKTTY